MCFLFSGVFWGVILILLGLSVIVRIVFQVHIPLFRIVVALILIYLGLQVLLGGFWRRPCCGRDSTMFNESSVSANNINREYSVIFGKSTVDATDSSLTDQNRKIRINTVFGECVLKIAANVPTLVKVSAAFSGARFPDGNSAAFGDYYYKNKSYRDGADHRRIDANVVFGSLQVLEQ